jgi:hypothetical protein
MRISNRRNNGLSSSRSVDNSLRSPVKLRLSSSCNMRIRNRRNNNLPSSMSVDNSWRRSTGNLPLRSRCNLYNSLCNRRGSPDNLPLQKGNQARKPLSKDEILNFIIGTKQE